MSDTMRTPASAGRPGQRADRMPSTMPDRDRDQHRREDELEGGRQAAQDLVEDRPLRARSTCPSRRVSISRM